MEEAERCLQCKNPRCIDGCPVRVDIPGFIELLADGDFEGAAESLLDDNALPGVTGRVCPQETQCEGVCVRGKKGEPVAIGCAGALRGRLGARAPRRAARAVAAADTGQRVAVVGSGPGRPDRRRRAGQVGPRRHRLRGPARARRRAGLRHPRVPPAQGHRPAGGRPPARPWA